LSSTGLTGPSSDQRSLRADGDIDCALAAEVPLSRE
jgi:hypothetical protein